MSWKTTKSSKVRDRYMYILYMSFFCLVLERYGSVQAHVRAYICTQSMYVLIYAHSEECTAHVRAYIRTQRRVKYLGCKNIRLTFVAAWIKKNVSAKNARAPFIAILSIVIPLS